MILFGGRRVRGFGLSDPVSNAEQQLWNALPPDVQAQFTDASHIAANLTPAVNLARTIGSGGVPDPNAVLAAFAAATSIVSPVAGVALAAGEGVMQGLLSLLTSAFSALGLYDYPLSWNYLGYQRTGIDPIPYGPGDTNNWISLDNVLEWRRANCLGTQGAPPPYDQWPGNTTPVLPGGRPCRQAVTDQGFAQNELLRAALMQRDGYATPGGIAYGPQVTKAIGFPLFYVTMLVRDLQNWANALPYLDPQGLLTASVQAWNSIHSGSSTVTYSGSNPDASWNAIDTVSMTLAAKFSQNNTDAPPITVNTGPMIVPSSVLVAGATTVVSTPQAASVSTGSKLATGAAIVAVGAGGAVALYAAQHGVTMAQAARQMWDTLRRFVPNRAKRD